MRVEKRRIVFGLKHDFGDSPEPLMHELGHFIEIDEPRLGLPDWGLKNDSPLNAFTSGKRISDADVRREFRVVAMQANLSAYFAIPFFVETSSLPIRHCNGYRTYVKEHGDNWVTTADVHVPAEIHALQLDPAYSPDLLLAELHRRALLLEREPVRLRPGARE
jgi:hypothetical protein